MADMTPAAVSEQQVLDSLRQVPAERWGDVLRYLDELRTPPVEPAGPPIRTVGDLLNSELVALWAHRTDIMDSREFARRLRYEAEHRIRGNEIHKVTNSATP